MPIFPNKHLRGRFLWHFQYKSTTKIIIRKFRIIFFFYFSGWNVSPCIWLLLKDLKNFKYTSFWQFKFNFLWHFWIIILINLLGFESRLMNKILNKLIIPIFDLFLRPECLFSDHEFKYITDYHKNIEKKILRLQLLSTMWKRLIKCHKLSDSYPRETRAK